MRPLRPGACAVIAALAAAACGYQPVYATRPARLHVALVRSLVADAVAADEVASGVREELARAGALEPGEEYPRVEVEVLRADASSEGAAAGATGPVARGTGVAVVARAWIVPTADSGARVADTGDVRSEASITVDRTPANVLDARADVFHQADAMRAAARRLGRKLGARVLGMPAAGEE